MNRSSSLRLTRCPSPRISSVSVAIDAPPLNPGRLGRAGLDPGGVLDGLHDVHVAGTSAQVAGDGPSNILVGWVGVALEEGLAHQHHPGSAEAALEAVLLLERNLDRIELTVRHESLDRRDLPALRLDAEHRARPTARGVTSLVGPGQAERVPDEVDQKEAGLDVGGSLRPVDLDTDLHVCPPQAARAISTARARPRRTNTSTTWRLYSAEPRTSATGLHAAAASRPASANSSSLGSLPASADSASAGWTFLVPTAVRPMPARPIVT